MQAECRCVYKCTIVLASTASTMLVCAGYGGDVSPVHEVRKVFVKISLSQGGNPAGSVQVLRNKEAV